MKPVKITKTEWKKLWPKIIEDNGKAILIRDTCKKRLGFTVRKHAFWDSKKNSYIDEIHLDFYDDAMRTLFLLRYYSGSLNT